jgi:hypothetical protein
MRPMGPIELAVFYEVLTQRSTKYAASCHRDAAMAKSLADAVRSGDPEVAAVLDKMSDSKLAEMDQWQDMQALVDKKLKKP